MTKIVIAPDKFKGSVTSRQFCDAVEKGLLTCTPDIEIIKLPLADGGDGTINVLNYYLNGKMITVEVHDPLHRKIRAQYLYSIHKKTAYIEMAAASGIALLNPSETNPMLTSTYGTGELINSAIKNGAEHIILGIGGSATNDGGLGMARALGYHFFDSSGNELQGFGKDLIRLCKIDDTKVNPALSNVKFDLACDVDNPLFGYNGAANIYAQQKGATPEMVLELDKGLQNFNNLISRKYDIHLQTIKGAGAAGGLGAGSMIFLNAKINAGIDLIKKEAGFNEKILSADWIITGEGKLDDQTLNGKVIKGIVDSITHQKLAVFCGENKLQKEKIKHLKIGYLKEISAYSRNLKDSMLNAEKYLQLAAEEFAKISIL